MKYLHIIEYSKYGKIPVKESFEHEFKTVDGNTIRSSVIDDKKDNYCSDFDNIINTYNKLSGVVEDKTISLKDSIIYDNLDINNPKQKIVYVLECPICLNCTITSDSKIDTCPQCGNNEFSFNVKALINQEQMEDLAINNDDVTTLIIVNKDGNIQFIDKAKEE